VKQFASQDGARGAALPESSLVSRAARVSTHPASASEEVSANHWARLRRRETDGSSRVVSFPDAAQKGQIASVTLKCRWQWPQARKRVSVIFPNVS